jgi:hypothetical protein
VSIFCFLAISLTPRLNIGNPRPSILQFRFPRLPVASVDEWVLDSLEAGDFVPTGWGWPDMDVTISSVLVLFRLGTEPEKPDHDAVAEAQRKIATPAVYMSVGEPEGGDVMAAEGKKGDGKGRGR